MTSSSHIILTFCQYCFYNLSRPRKLFYLLNIYHDQWFSPEISYELYPLICYEKFFGAGNTNLPLKYIITNTINN